MKTLYELLNIDLVQQYTKERKLAVLDTIELNSSLKSEAKAAIEAMDIPTDDDRYHWIQVIGRQAAADLLTLGKVQPDNMLAMAGLSTDDFKEAVRVATTTARSLNDTTVAAEQELNSNIVSEAIV
tara:strand:+ start:13352 stop:13729 length:378 start_codon:yes stop_codon:yes gene_type:complete